MIEVLQDLRDNHNVIELKAELETEGTRLNELAKLKDIAAKARLGLTVKIGGAEAITDMLYACDIGVDKIVSPMVETAYAVKKYIEAIQKYSLDNSSTSISFGINIETITAVNNLSEILSLESINTLNFITVGRGDLAGSLGLTRKNVNDKQIATIVKDILQRAKDKKLHTNMGGGIDHVSIPFIKQLAQEKLLDSFETRKVVFKISELSMITEEAINKALDFELLWLKNKKEYYMQIANEDESRLESLTTRIKQTH